MTCHKCRWLYKLGTPCNNYWLYCIRPQLHPTSNHYVTNKQEFIKQLAELTAKNCIMYIDNGKEPDIIDYKEYCNDPYLWLRKK